MSAVSCWKKLFSMRMRSVPASNTAVLRRVTLCDDGDIKGGGPREEMEVNKVAALQITAQGKSQ